MATKKAASNTKKSSTRKAPSVASTTTVRTIKSTPAVKRGDFGTRFNRSVRSFDLWRTLGAEFVGSFLLAAAIITGSNQPIFALFAVVGIVLMFGAVSGSHINPAVTLAAWATRRIGWLRALGYVAAQLLGAALAFVALSTFINGAPGVSEEAAMYGQSAPELYRAAEQTVFAGKEWFVFFAEALGAAIIGYAFAASRRVTVDRLTGAFTYGLGVFVALMVGVSAASYVSATAALNPAVAVALQAFNWNEAWTFAIYAAGPVLGAIVGFIVHDILTPKV